MGEFSGVYSQNFQTFLHLNDGSTIPWVNYKYPYHTRERSIFHVTWDYWPVNNDTWCHFIQCHSGFRVGHVISTATDCYLFLGLWQVYFLATQRVDMPRALSNLCPDTWKSERNVLNKQSTGTKQKYCNSVKSSYLIAEFGQQCLALIKFLLQLLDELIFLLSGTDKIFWVSLMTLFGY
jgi:hypothetical protein